MAIRSQVHLIFLRIRPSKLNLILSKDDEERCHASKDLFKKGYTRDPFYQVSKPYSHVPVRICTIQKASNPR